MHIHYQKATQHTYFMCIWHGPPLHQKNRTCQIQKKEQIQQRPIAHCTSFPFSLQVILTVGRLRGFVCYHLKTFYTWLWGTCRWQEICGKFMVSLVFLHKHLPRDRNSGRNRRLHCLFYQLVFSLKSDALWHAWASLKSFHIKGMTWKSALASPARKRQTSEIRHLFHLAEAVEGLEGPRAYITQTNIQHFTGLHHRKGSNL